MRNGEVARQTASNDITRFQCEAAARVFLGGGNSPAQRIEYVAQLGLRRGSRLLDDHLLDGISEGTSVVIAASDQPNRQAVGERVPIVAPRPPPTLNRWRSTCPTAPSRFKPRLISRESWVKKGGPVQVPACTNPKREMIRGSR